MLRLRSLRARAALWFMAVYAVIFLGGFLLLAWQSLTTGGERHHAGPTIALGLLFTGRPLPCAISAVLMGVLLYGLFDYLLDVPLPLGLFEAFVES